MSVPVTSGGTPVAPTGYAVVVPRIARLTLVVLGLAAALYGTASLTGGWLGTPPWWETAGLVTYSTGGRYRANGSVDEPFCVRRDIPPEHVPRDSDPYLGGGVVGAGLALAAFGAWPDRRQSSGGT